MASVMQVFFGDLPVRSATVNYGSRYGVITAVSSSGLYTVNTAGTEVTAQTRVGPVSVNDAVIVQQTGAGYFITAKIGMAEKIPDLVMI